MVDMENAMRQKARGSIDASFWNAAADEMARNRAAIAELVGALTAFRDSGPSGGQDFLNWHESYRAAIEKARALITKYGD